MIITWAFRFSNVCLTISSDLVLLGTTQNSALLPVATRALLYLYNEKLVIKNSCRQLQWSVMVRRFRKQKSCCHVIAIPQAGIAAPTLTVMQGFEAKKWLLRAFSFPLLRTASILRILPFHAFVTVEASHANADARAIAFFSYIWFKYDILSLQCCNRDWLCKRDTECRNLEGDVHTGSYLFLLQNLALQLGLGQRCQPEGIAIM